MCLGGVDPKYGFREVERSFRAARLEADSEVRQGWLQPAFTRLKTLVFGPQPQPIPVEIPAGGA